MVLADQSAELVAGARARIDATYKRSSAFKAKTAKDPAAAEADVAATLSLLTTVAAGTEQPGSLGAAFGEVDVVIEAVMENMAVKKAVFKALAAEANPSAVLCTNTSTLSIDEIADGAGPANAGRVVGTHFFSPAHIMRLLENVQGSRSSPEAVATAMEIGKVLGKVPVLSGNCFGFIGNRMLEGYGQEAAFCVEEGATPAEVDRALNGFGMAMGLFAMSDLAGTDIGLLVRSQFGCTDSASPFGNGRRYPALLDVIPNAGLHGQKTGSGWCVKPSLAEPRGPPSFPSF